MTYNATHAMRIERALKTMQPGDFFLINNGMTWNNLTASHFENTSIRAVPGSPFGHGALYLGNGKALEMPIAAWKVRDLFAKDRTNAVAFVHCKTLTRAQRGRILWFAREYHKYNRTHKGWKSYDLVSLSVGSAGEIVTAGVTLRGLNPVTTIPEVKDGVHAITQTPATILTMFAAKVNELAGSYPALSCVSLITYAHAVAGHTIDAGYVSYPTHTTPGILWDVVKRDEAKYRVTLFDFSKDFVEPKDTASVAEGKRIVMGPMP